jgi:hypothetical protein
MIMLKATIKAERFKALFTWGLTQKHVETPQDLIDLFTCEALPHEKIPEEYKQLVAMFRRLNTTTRLSAARTFLRK